MTKKTQTYVLGLASGLVLAGFWLCAIFVAGGLSGLAVRLFLAGWALGVGR